VSEIIVDTRHLAGFATKLRETSLALETKFYQGLAVAGEIVAEEARHNARTFPRQYDQTDRIAKSVHVKRRKSVVKIIAGGTGAPEAAPIEHGGLGGTFRHPVFGHMDRWVPQPAFSFLTTASQEKSEEVEAAVAVAIDVALAQMVL
jgi:hypothetical protein